MHSIIHYLYISFRILAFLFFFFFIDYKFQYYTRSRIV